jgi:hypothetical protein
MPVIHRASRGPLRYWDGLDSDLGERRVEVSGLEPPTSTLRMQIPGVKSERRRTNAADQSAKSGDCEPSRTTASARWTRDDAAVVEAYVETLARLEPGAQV